MPICNQLRQIIACSLLVGVTAGGGTSRVEAAEADAASMLNEARAAMAARDLPAAKSKLDEAAAAAGAAESADERARVELLYDYLLQFWKAVDQGGQSLQATDEILVGKTPCVVVEYGEGTIVVRLLGQNRRYTLKTMPPKLALTLAERALKAGDATNNVFLGTFQLMDGKGDRGEAARLLQAAQRAGVDVAAILPELGTAPVSGVAIEIPPLPPLMRKTLAPDNWLLRKIENERPKRQALGDAGNQNAEGRLELANSAAPETPAQFVYLRRQAGNFGCRVILQGVAAGQKFGLYAPDSAAALEVDLPPGTVAVEIARQGGEVKCRINQRDVELQSRNDATPRMPGHLGVTLPAGGRCTIAWFELRSR